MKKTTNTIDLSESSSSLIAKVGQVMAVIITLGLVSMISSMLVTESLNGDAAQINQSGALRMQAVRISRTYFIDQSPEKKIVKAQMTKFNEHLTQLFHGSNFQKDKDNKITHQYETILTLWKKINQQTLPTEKLSHQELVAVVNLYDRFVKELDKLVSLLQLESEKTLSFLRLIQSSTLFLVIAVAGFVLFKLNRVFIVPLKQLVNVAEQAGKGNFDLKASYDKKDELGVLAHTINQMSDELKLTYQNFEQRVKDKTNQLSISNQSLELLYRAARNLAEYTGSEQATESFKVDQQIIVELEQVLGYGKIMLEFNNNKSQMAQVDDIQHSLNDIVYNEQKFPLEKKTLLFGYLVWKIPKGEGIHAYQQQILQAMADIIATAIELEQKRASENRLLIVEERAVIARELHDSLAQSLSYLKVQMSLLTRKMEKQLPQEQVEETIDDIKQGLNNAYLQLRELLTTFRLKLEDPQIKNSLQTTVTEFSAKCQHGIKFNYQLPQNYLSANQEIHLLQIVREALSNIHRHANATQAGVDIELHDNKVYVSIWDNGEGLSDNIDKRGHFGISIMQERAKSLNAVLDYSPLDNKHLSSGTRITFEFSH